MKLHEYIPEITYSHEKHVVDFQNAIQLPFDDLQQVYDDFLKQLSPTTATWGLAYYEKEYGVRAKYKESIEERRSALLAKMRGVGTTTKEMVENVANSFYQGEVEVVEETDEYLVIINFVSEIGIPPNIESLKAVLKEIIPAHLNIEYVILYNTHDFLSQFTNDQLSQFTHQELRVKKFGFNSYNLLKKYTHKDIGKYRHKQLMMEVLE